MAPDSLGNFYKVTNNKIADNSTTTETGAKISTDLESFKF
jgi:hypothetical protein